MSSQPENGADRRLGDFLAAWVDRAQRRARPVVALILLGTLGALGYAVFNLGVNADASRIVSRDLAFRRLYDQFAQVFPILDEALLVVVDAETPYDASRAAEALATRLAERPDRFQDVFVPGEGAFFHRHALLYLSPTELENLADQLAEYQPVLAELARDGSLHGLVSALADAVESAPAETLAHLDWASLLERLAQGAEAALEDEDRQAWWHSLLYGQFFPDSSPRRVIITQPVLDLQSLLPARDAILEVRRASEELGLVAAQGIDVRVTGNVALNFEEMLVVAYQAITAGAASFVLVGIILTVGLSSARLIASILITLFSGLIWTGAFAAATVGYVNLISVAFAVLFIGLGVDFGIHFGMRYAEVMRRGTTREEALRETARSIGGSLAICACTTAVGFFVFLPTDFRAVAELGLISGTGMFISLFLNLTLLPALLSLGKPGVAPDHRAWLDHVDAALSHLPTRHPRAVGFSAAAIGLGALLLLPAASFDHDVVRLRDSATESVMTFNDLLSERETSPWYIDVIAPDLESAPEMAARLEALDVVDRATTILDYIPKDQAEKLAILEDVALFLPLDPSFDPASPPAGRSDQLAALARFRDVLRESFGQVDDPELRAAALHLAVALDRFLGQTGEDGQATRLLARLEEELVGRLPEQLRRFWLALAPSAVELADIPPDLAARMLTDDGRARIQVLPSEDLKDRAAMDRFVDEVRVIVPDATGSAVSLLETARAIVRSLQQALVAAVIVVSLLLWVLWRRVWDTLLVMVPLALAAALTGASSVLMAQPFNFVNVVVLPLLLGIGVDSGIHLVHRHRMSALGGEAILRTSTARAILFSALTTVGSFGTLTFSSHTGMSSLGQLLTVGIVCTLVCNLIVLPALLTLRHGSPLAPRDTA